MVLCSMFVRGLPVVCVAAISCWCLLVDWLWLSVLTIIVFCYGVGFLVLGFSLGMIWCFIWCCG